MLRQEPLEWTCIAGYKYFFVSATGKFWLCSQVRTERHILEITREDLLGYNRKKSCQAGCGVYCTAEASLAVSHPLQYVAREAAGILATRVSKMRGGQPERIRDLVGGCRNGHTVAAGRGQDPEPTSTQVIKDQSHACGAGCK
jgi:hypothetical protein